MSDSFQVFIIDLISIKPGKSPSQTHNAQVLLKKPKAIYLGQVAE